MCASGIDFEIFAISLFQHIATIFARAIVEIMFGIIPYYLKGKFSKDSGGSFSTDLNGVNSKVYNIMASVLEPIEKKLKPKAGLSEIIILEKS